MPPLARILGSAALLMSFARAAAAESVAAEIDLELSLTASTYAAAPDEAVEIVVNLANESSWQSGDAEVVITLPPALIFMSADSDVDTDSFDAETGLWTSTRPLAYDSSALTLHVTTAPDFEGATVVAEVVSVEAPYGGNDRDSIPGNGDPCEDDYARVDIGPTEPVAAESPDGGPSCDPPPQPPAPLTDAGATSYDGGAGANEEVSGCAAGGSGSPTVAALVLALLAGLTGRRRFESRV